MREHERRQKLCRDAGCFCTEEDVKRYCPVCPELCKELAKVRAQAERSANLATERGQIISECARQIPIMGPLLDRIRFLMQCPRLIETGAIDYPRLMAEQQAEIAKLREERADLLDEIARHKQERRDNFDEIRERF
jgi:hypothetical protein